MTFIFRVPHHSDVKVVRGHFVTVILNLTMTHYLQSWPSLTKPSLGRLSDQFHRTDPIGSACSEQSPNPKTSQRLIVK